MILSHILFLLFLHFFDRGFTRSHIGEEKTRARLGLMTSTSPTKKSSSPTKKRERKRRSHQLTTASWSR